MNDLPRSWTPSRPTRALWGLGSGVAGAAALLVRSSGPASLATVPVSLPMIGSLAVPAVTLLALVGPTGLTFPCWAVDVHSPGIRLLRWVRGRLPS